MLKLRLTRIGRKKHPFYRIVVIVSTSRRQGRFVDDVGYYNVMDKSLKIDIEKVKKWLNYGVKPTSTVYYLLKKLDIIHF